MSRGPSWEDKLEARRLIRLGAPDGHRPAPCRCRQGFTRDCAGVCEDLVDAIAQALVNRDELDDEIPF
jgi:hypothetical protein